MEIPNSVIGVVAEAIHDHYTHDRLNNLFLACGAPGEPPLGSKLTKCHRWLMDCNNDPNIDPLKLLGKLIEEYMDVPPNEYQREEVAKEQTRIQETLQRHGLLYSFGGQITNSIKSYPAENLKFSITNMTLPALADEFKRINNTIESDPPVGLTAACALIEALCKDYIEEYQLNMPSKQTIKPLWSVVATELGLNAQQVEDNDLKKILSGLSSVVDGLGALRTHAGSAHGSGKKVYRVEPRHARLAANAAYTIASFVCETRSQKCAR